jgi:hypothetical protein
VCKNLALVFLHRSDRYVLGQSLTLPQESPRAKQRIDSTRPKRATSFDYTGVPRGPKADALKSHSRRANSQNVGLRSNPNHIDISNRLRSGLSGSKSGTNNKALHRDRNKELRGDQPAESISTSSHSIHSRNELRQEDRATSSDGRDKSSQQIPQSPRLDRTDAPLTKSCTDEERNLVKTGSVPDLRVHDNKRELSHQPGGNVTKPSSAVYNGRTDICDTCSTSETPSQPFIKCDFCGYQWHAYHTPNASDAQDKR